MRVKCRGFEGQLLSLNAETLHYRLCDKPWVDSYCLEILQDTGEEIKISGLCGEEIKVIWDHDLMEEDAITNKL